MRFVGNTIQFKILKCEFQQSLCITFKYFFNYFTLLSKNVSISSSASYSGNKCTKIAQLDLATTSMNTNWK